MGCQDLQPHMSLMAQRMMDAAVFLTPSCAGEWEGAGEQWVPWSDAVGMKATRAESGLTRKAVWAKEGVFKAGGH